MAFSKKTQALARFASKKWPVMRADWRSTNNFDRVTNETQSSANRFCVGLVTALVAFCSLFSNSSHARIIILEAKISYSATSDPGDSLHDTTQEAYEVAVARYAVIAPYLQLTGLIGCVDPNQQTVNGKPTVLCSNAIDTRTFKTEVIQAVYYRVRCPEGLGNPELYTIAAPRTLGFRCTTSIPDTECAACPLVGNPVSATRGWKFQTETDYSAPSGMSFTQRYRSNIGSFSSILTGGLVDRSQFGITSGACYQGRIVSQTDSFLNPTEWRSHCFPYVGDGASNYQFIKPNGYTTQFNGSPTATTKPANINESATQLTDAQGVKTWQIRHQDDTVEIYSANGLLQRRTGRDGQIDTFSYSDSATAVSVAPRPGLMLSQTGNFGHTLQWRYNAQGLMTQMIDPADGIFDYTYDNYNNLSSVTYPPESNGTRRTKSFHYEIAAKPRLLTGITDEKGFRFAAYSYDSNDRVTVTQHFAAPAVAVNRFQLSYPINGSSAVIDPLSTTRNYAYTNIQIGRAHV